MRTGRPVVNDGRQFIWRAKVFSRLPSLPRRRLRQVLHQLLQGDQPPFHGFDPLIPLPQRRLLIADDAVQALDGSQGDPIGIHRRDVPVFALRSLMVL